MERFSNLQSYDATTAGVTFHSHNSRSARISFAPHDAYITAFSFISFGTGITFLAFLTNTVVRGLKRENLVVIYMYCYIGCRGSLYITFTP